MSEMKSRVFACDVPGCKSFCDVGHAVHEDDIDVLLHNRGWRMRESGGKTQHLCQGHVSWDGVPDVNTEKAGAD